MIEVNLLPPELLKRKEIKYFIIFVSTCGLLTILVCFFLSFGVKNEIKMAQERLISVQEKSREQQSVIKELEEWKRKKVDIESRFKAMANLVTRKSLCPKILYEISRCLPGNIWLTGLIKDIQGKEEIITIQGSSLTQTVDIARFMENLDNSSLFKGISLCSISREETTGIAKFKITCKLREEGN